MNFRFIFTRLTLLTKSIRHFRLTIELGFWLYLTANIACFHYALHNTDRQKRGPIFRPNPLLSY